MEPYARAFGTVPEQRPCPYTFGNEASRESEILVCKRTYPARVPAAGGLREEFLELGDELVDLVVADPATASRHRLRRGDTYGRSGRKTQDTHHLGFVFSSHSERAHTHTQEEAAS
jgi:hypothetical protein